VQQLSSSSASSTWSRLCTPRRFSKAHALGVTVAAIGFSYSSCKYLGYRRCYTSLHRRLGTTGCIGEGFLQANRVRGSGYRAFLIVPYLAGVLFVPATIGMGFLALVSWLRGFVDDSNGRRVCAQLVVIKERTKECKLMISTSSSSYVNR